MCFFKIVFCFVLFCFWMCFSGKMLFTWQWHVPTKRTKQTSQQPTITTITTVITHLSFIIYHLSFTFGNYQSLPSIYLNTHVFCLLCLCVCVCLCMCVLLLLSRMCVRLVLLFFFLRLFVCLFFCDNSTILKKNMSCMCYQAINSVLLCLSKACICCLSTQDVGLTKKTVLHIVNGFVCHIFVFFEHTL